tara:strand:+ start:225 stop:476 length:252 start_codon:yes stop_codon:yes gene_type:complete
LLCAAPYSNERIATRRRRRRNRHMPDVVVHCIEKDTNAVPEIIKPMPNTHWIRFRRAASFPFRVLLGFVKYLWNLAFGKRPIK